jgi:hypothetical protein
MSKIFKNLPAAMVASALENYTGFKLPTTHGDRQAMLANFKKMPIQKLVNGARKAAVHAGVSLGVTAPVSVGTVSRGTDLRFGAAQEGSDKGVKISGEMLWANVVTAASGATIIKQNGGATSLYNLFDPDNSVYTPPPFNTLASLFARYKLRRLLVKYCAGCPSSTAGEIAFGWSTDPVAELSSEFTVGFGSIAEMTNSMSGPPWVSMEMLVPCDNSMRFTYNTTTSGSLTDGEIRQVAAGAICGAHSGAAASTTLGTLRIKFECEFFELLPGVGQTSFMTRQRELCNLNIAKNIDDRIQKRQTEQKEFYENLEKKDTKMGPEISEVKFERKSVNLCSKAFVGSVNRDEDDDVEMEIIPPSQFAVAPPSNGARAKALDAALARKDLGNQPGLFRS